MKIIETLVTTCNADDTAHVAPFGVKGLDESTARIGGTVTLAPFRPSRSLDNLLRANAQAVIHLSDNPLLFAGCLVGKRDFPLRKAEKVTGWVLPQAVRAFEIEVVDIQDDEQRPRVTCSIVWTQNLSDWQGFNRAGMAIIEGCILMSRLRLWDATIIAERMAMLEDIVGRTSGNNEEQAWQWLQDYYRDHKKKAGHGGGQ
ncbi:MAG: DUF447 family protein [Alphaproteobacteria bacterium GM202ARS2]|nr:DUF447 family protein [Alphaproteobacteria bacterium GM202ARS2]